MDAFVFVLLFLGVVLFNYVMRQAARRREAEERAQAAGQPVPLPLEEAPLEDLWGRTAAPVPAPPPYAPRAVPAPPRPETRAPARLHPARALLRNRRDLRRAVVLTMILGPCRAQEPPER